MKKHISRIAALLCGLILLLSLCACADPNGPSSSEPTSSSPNVTPAGEYTLSERVAKDERVPFRDPKLEAAVRATMQLPDRYEITPQHMVGMMYLDIRGLGITDLDGLQYCTGLEVLYASDNEIVHLDAIEDLVDLFILDVGSNRIEDFSKIYGLSNLMLLDVTNNPGDTSMLSSVFNIDHTYLCETIPTARWEF